MASGFFAGGTVSVANGGTAVTGTGSGFTQVQAGGRFEAQGHQVTIASIASNTELTLALPWPGTTMTDDANYLVHRISDGAFLVVQNEQKLGELLSDLALKPGIFVRSGTPGIGDGTDDDIWIDSDAKNLLHKDAGVWTTVWTGTITSAEIGAAVVLTEAAFDALVTKDPNTLYATTEA